LSQNLENKEAQNGHKKSTTRKGARQHHLRPGHQLGVQITQVMKENEDLKKAKEEVEKDGKKT